MKPNALSKEIKFGMKNLSRIVINIAAVGTFAVAAVAQSHDQSHEEHGHGATATAGVHTDHETSDDDMAVKTVTGEVIDITCFVRHDSKGPEHIKCANVCADLGMPLGILEDGTNAIYLILPGGHAAPKEAVDGFFGQHITAKLMIFRSGGLNSAEVMEIAAVEPKKG